MLGILCAFKPRNLQANTPNLLDIYVKLMNIKMFKIKTYYAIKLILKLNFRFKSTYLFWPIITILFLINSQTHLFKSNKSRGIKRIKTVSTNGRVIETHSRRVGINQSTMQYQGSTTNGGHVEGEPQLHSNQQMALNLDGSRRETIPMYNLH